MNIELEETVIIKKIKYDVVTGIGERREERNAIIIIAEKGEDINYNISIK